MPDTTEVLSKLGQPSSISAKGEAEFLSYRLCKDECWRMPGFRVMGPYYVKLVNGKVESFGEKGDFDSTKTPTVRIEIDEKKEVRTKDSEDMYTELRKLKDLKDSGIITQEEFDFQKKRLLSK